MGSWPEMHLKWLRPNLHNDIKNNESSSGVSHMDCSATAVISIDTR